MILERNFQNGDYFWIYIRFYTEKIYYIFVQTIKLFPTCCFANAFLLRVSSL